MNKSCMRNYSAAHNGIYARTQMSLHQRHSLEDRQIIKTSELMAEHEISRPKHQGLFLVF